jgi:hypothetical protein
MLQIRPFRIFCAFRKLSIKGDMRRWVSEMHDRIHIVFDMDMQQRARFMKATARFRFRSVVEKPVSDLRFFLQPGSD